MSSANVLWFYVCIYIYLFNGLKWTESRETNRKPLSLVFILTKMLVSCENSLSQFSEWTQRKFPKRVAGAYNLPFFGHMSQLKLSKPKGSLKHLVGGFNAPELNESCPIGSMYGIYGSIYHQYTPNVSTYTIHIHTWVLWVWDYHLKIPANKKPRTS